MLIISNPNVINLSFGLAVANSEIFVTMDLKGFFDQLCVA